MFQTDTYNSLETRYPRGQSNTFRRERSEVFARIFKGSRAASALFVVLVAGLLKTWAVQEFLPAPPPDRSLIYVLDDQNRLAPLPFETGQTPLHPEQVAKNTKVSYIELKGEHSTTILKGATPRWFLFTYQRPGAHPPFLVWLTPHHGARRVTAIAQRGMSGLAISSDEIIKPTVRVLASVGGDRVFMEMRPRDSLIPGEYAIIGDDLKHIATFRVIMQP